jgi:hypothetical protein
MKKRELIQVTFLKFCSFSVVELKAGLAEKLAFICMDRTEGATLRGGKAFQIERKDSIRLGDQDSLGILMVTMSN